MDCGNPIEKPGPSVRVYPAILSKIDFNGKNAARPADVSSPPYQRFLGTLSPCDVVGFDIAAIAPEVAHIPVPQSESVFAQAERPIPLRELEQPLVRSVGESGETLQKPEVGSRMHAFCRIPRHTPHDVTVFQPGRVRTNAEGLRNHRRA